jgi:hypothetical protein
MEVDAAHDDLTDDDTSDVPFIYNENSDVNEFKRNKSNQANVPDAELKTPTNASYNYPNVKKHPRETNHSITKICDVAAHSSSDRFGQRRDMGLEQKQNDDETLALEFLLRYETMVRQQEAENMSVVSHLKPCLERLQELVFKEGQDLPSSNSEVVRTNGKETSSDAITDDLKRTISYSDLRKGLDILDRKVQERKVLSGPGNDTTSCVVPEFMLTDRQFMMVLRILTSSVSHELSDDSLITWAEIIQCYKICISGMVALEHLTLSPERKQMTTVEDNHQETGHRQRVRDRTLTVLSFFKAHPFGNQLRMLPSDDDKTNRIIDKKLRLVSDVKRASQTVSWIPILAILFLGMVFISLSFWNFPKQIHYSSRTVTTGSFPETHTRSTGSHFFTESTVVSDSDTPYPRDRNANNLLLATDSNLHLESGEYGKNDTFHASIHGYNESMPQNEDKSPHSVLLEKSMQSNEIEQHIAHRAYGFESHPETYLAVARYTGYYHPYAESIVAPALITSMTLTFFVPGAILAQVVFAPLTFMIGKTSLRWLRRIMASIRGNLDNTSYNKPITIKALK